MEDLHEAAFAALDDDPEAGLRLAREALSRQPDAEGHYVYGVALCAAGKVDEGLTALRKAIELDPEHVEAWVSLGCELYDGRDFEDARIALLNALRIDPHHPEALYYRASLRERRGDFDGASRDYEAAALVDPEGFPRPIPLDDDTIEELAEAVIGELHPSLQRYLGNVAILVDEVPASDILAEFEPPARPNELLGCFSGPSLAEREQSSPWSSFPATIVLFRRNLQRIAHDRAELLSELRITLLHEIGHFLGLDEEDLERRGLD